MDQKSVTNPKETEILFGLLRGCDFNGLAPYMHAVTQHNEKVQIMGFVNRNWAFRIGEWNQIVESHKVFDDYSNIDFKVLGVVQSASVADKQKNQSEFHLYDPNDLKVVNEASCNKAQQFQITAEVLNSLLKECDLLTSIEEEGSGSMPRDIYKLNQRTILMKLINHQLQNNSEQFLSELKKSEYYQSLLKFVCKESSVEMKGDIMLLDWLEYKCFSIRKYACENQQSLARQRDVHASLIKTKIYVSYEVNGDKNMTGVKIKSAVNFKNFEERKDIKLVHCNDVFVTEDAKSSEKQIVLIDPDTLMTRANGLDILNSCEAAITYNTDLNQLIKKIFGKQREDRDKYIELAQKTVFLVSHSDYHSLNDILQSKQTFKSASKQNVTPQNEDDESFDKILSREIINYGNYHPSIAKKLLEQQGLTIEKRTEKLVQLSKQLKEGILDLEDDTDVNLLPQATSQKHQLFGIQSFNQQPSQPVKPAEESSETLNYLKNSFHQYLEREHDDRLSRSASHDALYDCMNNFNRNDLPGEYEKSLIRLFNMYCRHVFWSLLQKDDIQKIFSMILETQQDMKSFAVFMKVLGNECFITGNKVYIKGYKIFLKKVVAACSGEDNKNREFIKILIKDGLIHAYQNNLLNEVRNDPQPHSQRRIEEFFKTESKASQLMNPFIIQPLLRQIIDSDPELLEPFIDRLVSILVSVICLFVGNYSLKETLWELIISLLERIRQRVHIISPEITKSLLGLKVISYIFKDFEDQSHYEREESEFAKRQLKDNSGSKIDGISRKDTEKLVYARRATCLQFYLRHQNKEKHTKAIIEMLFKMYQIDREVHRQSQFKFKNNLMSHMDIYSKIIDQGQDGELNQYLLFQNYKLEDQNLKIITNEVETNHKEFEGNYTAHFNYPGAEKVLVKFNESTNLQPGSAVLISRDKEGENLISLTMENNLKKDLSFYNIYGDNFYLHYPVYPSANYCLNVTEDSPSLQLLENPSLYKPLIRVYDQNNGKFFLTSDNELYLYKNEKLRRYKDHLEFQQVTFGKQCIIMLLNNGKVWGEGRNKARHFMDSAQEVIDFKGVEVPFYEKKDKIVQISTFFQVTIAVTEQGRVFAVGDKLAKVVKVDTQGKFGFFEIPVLKEKKSDIGTEENKSEEVNKKVEEQKVPIEEEKVEEVKEQVQEIIPVPKEAEDNIPEHNDNNQDNANQPNIAPEVQEQNQPEQLPVPDIPVEPAIPVQNNEAPLVQEEVKAIELGDIVLGENNVPAVEQIDQEQSQDPAEESQIPLENEKEVIPTSIAEEQINTSSKVQEDEDEALHALKVWACKSVTPTELVYLVLVVGTKSGRTELRSIGQSQFGNLGQGLDIKTSHSFQLVDLNRHEVRSNNDVFIGDDNTFIVNKEGQLYGWGAYTPDDKPIFKPTLVQYFDKFNIISVSGGQRTCALVSPKDQQDKRLIVFGKFAPFVNENSVKVFDVLNGLNVYSIQALPNSVIISTQGSYKYKEKLSLQNFEQKHEQKCELCTVNPTGVLHFFKDKEDKYHFFCIQCVKSGDMANKYQPDLMWVIKRPIKDLESKPWAIYNPDQLLQADSRNTIFYVTKVKINGKEISHQYSLDDIIEPSQLDLNPEIYLRLSRPLKEGALINLINIESFYAHLSTNGLSIRISPDYGFNEKATMLIEKNQSLFDEFKKAMNEIEEVKDQALKKEFKAKIEEYVAKKIKDTNIQDLLLKDCKITEETLKFSSETLSELSEDCKRIHIGKYLQYLQYLWGAYSYIHRDADSLHANDFSLLKIYNQNKSKIPLIIKNKILKKLTESIGSDSGGKSVHVNRKKARDFIASGKVDEKGEHTVFAQVFRELSAMNYQGMKINTADKKAWFVKFIGEYSMDHGGLFRESLTDMCHELQSHVLNLLVPTQNNKGNQGENRDRWTVNPMQQITTQQGKMYEFLGALIGMCVRSGILMNLNLPGFIWKQLTEEEVNLQDLEEIDKIAVNFISTLKEVRQTVNEDQFLEGYDLYFTTILSNAQEVELCNGGKTKRVDYSNLDEYIKKVIHTRLTECKEQIKHIKKGIDISFDSRFLRLLSWKDLQYKVVGQEKIDVERLKKMTVYRDCNESHDIVKKFWKILASISNEDRILYLKFVWGRTRLPLKEEEVTEDHTIQFMDKADVNLLPVGRTCFFRLEVPPYKSEDVFRDKLLYAIRNCTVIDADIEHVVANDNEDDSQHQDHSDDQLRRVNTNRIEDENDEENNEENNDDENLEDQSDEDDNDNGLFD